MFRFLLFFSFIGFIQGYNLTRVSHSIVGGSNNLNHITAVLVHNNIIYAPNYGWISSQQLNPADNTQFIEGTNFKGAGTEDQFNITLNKESVIVSTRHGGAYIYDIAGALANAPVPRYNLRQANSSFESGQMAANDIYYAAAHASGIVVYDLAAYYQPSGALEVPGGLTEINTPLKTVAGPRDAWSLALVDNYMYVADGPYGLAIINNSDPRSPVYLKNIPAGESGIVDVVAQGNNLILAAQGQGVLVYNITNRESPVLTGQYNTSANAIRVVADDQRIYVADMDDIEVIDYTTPGDLKLVGRHRLIERSMNVTLHNGFIYVAAWGGVEVFEWAHVDGPSGFFNHMRAFDFPRTALGSNVTEFMQVINHGNQPLVVTDVVIEGTEFTTTDKSFTVAANEDKKVGITYTPQAGAPRYTEAHGVVKSNDPVNPDLEFTLVGNKPSTVIMAGDVAPDFTLPKLDPAGENFTLSGQRGQKHIILKFFAPW